MKKKLNKLKVAPLIVNALISHIRLVLPIIPVSINPSFQAYRGNGQVTLHSQSFWRFATWVESEVAVLLIR
jgi:hypothetical protein